MQLSGFPGCCGATVIFNLGGEFPPEIIERALFPHGREARWEDAFKGEKEGETFVQASEIKGEMAVFATTIGVQREANRELKKLGFVPLAQWKNGLSHQPGKPGNRITLWMRLPEQGGRVLGDG